LDSGSRKEMQRREGTGREKNERSSETEKGGRE